MRIGTLRERKDGEGRVGLTPEGARILREHGHKIFVESNAGILSGFDNSAYCKAGACIPLTPEFIWKHVGMLVKVKEPLPKEYHLLERLRGKALITYLHLAGVEKALTEALVENRITGIGYELVEEPAGCFPLLAPMSKIAGEEAVLRGASLLEKDAGDTVVIIGGGTVGEAALGQALEKGFRVILFEKRAERVEELRLIFANNKHVEMIHGIREPFFSQAIEKADMLIGAVSVPGALAPIVVSEQNVAAMKPGAVIVDVAIDQGGCIRGSRPTTLRNPTYTDGGGRIYCCVPNLPGQVPLRATPALTEATLPFIVALAEKGVKRALKTNKGLSRGVYTYNGRITCKAVAEAHNMEDCYAPF